MLGVIQGIETWSCVAWNEFASIAFSTAFAILDEVIIGSLTSQVVLSVGSLDLLPIDLNTANYLYSCPARINLRCM